MGRKKKIIKDLLIDGIGDKARGVGRTEEGMVVFVLDVVPGDIVDVKVHRKKKSYYEARVIEYKTYSPLRQEAFCEHFGICGGCKYQNLKYEDQLKFKDKLVKDALSRIGKIQEFEFEPILGSEKTRFYRNKLEFSFSAKRWLTREEIDSGITNRVNVVGFHKSGAWDKCIDINECHLQSDLSNKIRNTMRTIAFEQKLDFFDIKENEGFLRQMMIRTSTLGDCMVVMAFYKNDQDPIKSFLDEVLQRIPEITSLFYCINDKRNNYINDLEMHLYYGEAFIWEKLRDVKFQIGPKSFFQTNTTQAEKLFEIVEQFAGLTGVENVYDLYTGIGSIGLFLAHKAKQVVGIEEVEQAIEDAKINIDLNNIENVVCYAGDVKNVLTPEFREKHGKPDVLITDPPRMGMHPKVIEILLELEAPKIVYVSCNPATQARDLQLMAEKYEVVKVKPVDMFPHTYHIENVALLKLKQC